MILYTMMPQELIYQTPPTDYGKQMMIQHEGIPLLVEMDENQDYRILRVMSSDPSHFLDERYSPGAILSFKAF